MTPSERASAGERVASLFNVDAPACPIAFRKRLADNIDRAIRAAVKEAWKAGQDHENECSVGCQIEMRERIEKKYGVKL